MARREQVEVDESVALVTAGAAMLMTHLKIGGRGSPLAMLNLKWGAAGLLNLA